MTASGDGSRRRTARRGRCAAAAARTASTPCAAKCTFAATSRCSAATRTERRRRRSACPWRFRWTPRRLRKRLRRRNRRRAETKRVSSQTVPGGLSRKIRTRRTRRRRRWATPTSTSRLPCWRNARPRWWSGAHRTRRRGRFRSPQSSSAARERKAIRRRPPRWRGTSRGKIKIAQKRVWRRSGGPTRDERRRLRREPIRSRRRRRDSPTRPNANPSSRIRRRVSRRLLSARAR